MKIRIRNKKNKDKIDKDVTHRGMLFSRLALRTIGSSR